MRYCTVLAVLTMGLVSAAPNLRADEPQPKPEGAVLESAPQKRVPAYQIDFNVELQVPLQALSHLGQTIEQARQEADPVCIASAANVLAAAEALAGDKKAALTSAELWDEAIELASLRNVSVELAALASLTTGDTAADLRQRSEAAKEAEQDAQAAAEAGETKRDVTGELHIINRTHEYIFLRVNGRPIGTIAPHGHHEMHVHGAVHLSGQSRHHRWHEVVRGHRHHYDWILRDPHDPYH